MPLGRKIAFLNVSTSRQAEQSWDNSAPKGPIHLQQYPWPWFTTSVHRYQEEKRRKKKKKEKRLKKKEKKKHACKLPVYMCFELCLTHNQKAINLQRPQSFIITNQWTVLAGLPKKAQKTVSVEVVHVTIRGACRGHLWKDFLWERHPGGGARVGVLLWESRSKS